MTPAHPTGNDVLFSMLMRSLVQEATGIVPEDSVAVSGIVRTTPETATVVVSLPSNIADRYALRLPLTTGDQALTPLAALMALRSAESLRRRDQPRFDDLTRADTVHGAPVLDGAELVVHTRESVLWQDDLRTCVSMLSQSSPVQSGQSAITLVGFDQFETEWFRVYLTGVESGSVVGLDVPRYPSAGLYSEIDSLLRDGVPANFAAHERDADDFCDHLYDLHPWFGRER